MLKEFKKKQGRLERTDQVNISNKTIEIIKQKSKEIVMASTCHGLPSVFRTKRIFFKIMWLSLFIISTLLGINTVIGTVNTYLNYEIVTKIDVITEIPTDFPAITIINLRNRKINITLNELMIYCNFNLEECNENDFEMIVDNYSFVSHRFTKKKILYSRYAVWFTIID